MNLVTSLQHLDPVILVALICGILFIEECGLPVPFAPGDLMLVFVGVTVAGGAVNPFVLLASVTLSMAIGAIAGREIFALIGQAILGRMAGALHCRGSLDRLTARLRQQGWHAVLLGRLTPGLRIHTTQAAGVAGVSRSTFIAGLLPALVLHVAVFVTVGALVGQPAITFVRQAEHGLLPIAAAAVAVGIAALIAKHQARRLPSLLRRARLAWDANDGRGLVAPVGMRPSMG